MNTAILRGYVLRDRYNLEQLGIVLNRHMQTIFKQNEGNYRGGSVPLFP